MGSGKDLRDSSPASSADTQIAPRVDEVTGSLFVAPEPTLVAGRYEILGLLGSGGMGRVYKAHDRELGEVVALKLLQVEAEDDPMARERFRREARLARRVTHGNVVRIFDIGDDRGRKFLTMELVDGESLAAVIEREGRLSVARVLSLAVEVCAGLAAAHAVGVIHRDLKPANVLLARDGRVLLTDFGIATSHAEAASAALTGALLVGTPDYMAPEQVEGSAEIDARTDLFAMGAMLFEMLVGEPPWTAKTAIAVAVARLSRPAPDLRAVRPDVPEALAAVVQRCLARRPEDRWPSALQLANALRAVEGPAAESPPPVSRPVVAPSLEFGAGRAGIKTLAVLPFRNGGRPEDAYVAEGLAEDLADTLSTTPGLRVRAPALARKIAGDGRDPLDAGRELGVQVVIEGSVRPIPGGMRLAVRALGVADGFQLWAQRFDRAVGDLLVASDEIARAIAAALATEIEVPERRVASDTLAVDLYLRGRHEYRRRFTIGSAQQAVALLEQAAAKAPEDAGIQSAHAMALVRSAWTASDEAARRVRAAEIAERAVATAPHLAEPWCALAHVRLLSGDVPAAVRGYVAALERNPALAEACENLGIALGEVGRVAEAKALLERALALDPTNESPAAWLANLHTFLGQRDEAAVWMDRIRTEEYRAIGLISRARALVHDGDVDGASRVLSTIGPDNPVAVVASAAIARATMRPAPAAGDEHLRRMTSMLPRRRSLVHQLLAEVEALGPDPEPALREIESAVEAGLIDITWLDHARPFERLRGTPRFAAARARVAAAAARVISVYEDATRHPGDAGATLP